MSLDKGGKPSIKDIKRLKKIKALMESSTSKEAYMKVHPNASPQTARGNAGTLVTQEIYDDIKKLIGIEMAVKADKDILEKVLFMVIGRWMSKKEKTGDMLAAIRELTKLVPEFTDKLQVEDISAASEEELDRKLRGFGYDPNIVQAN